MKEKIRSKLSLLFEFIILFLIISDILLLTSLFFIDVSPMTYKIIVYYDLCVVLVLIPEFLYRLWKSPDRKKFLLQNWPDILGMIPEILVGPISTFFRYFRLIRIVRIIALFKTQLRHFITIIHKTSLDYGIILVVIILMISSVLFFYFESGINDSVNTFDDAFWYLLVTITTVGYGDIYPKSSQGRILGFIIMATGIAFTSFLTATITSRFVKTSEKNKIEIVDKKLEKIQTQLINGSISPMDEINKAKALLSEGTISQDQFEEIKDKYIKKI